MSVTWIDVSTLSFNSLLLLERAQLRWFPGWLPEPELALALQANPAVGWYLRHQCPELEPWLDRVMALPSSEDASETALSVREAELRVMAAINDLLTYTVDPAIYDAQPFLGWDDRELTELADFSGKTVIDVGSGTGRLALVAAREAKVVYAVEPVTNLREYLRAKARDLGLSNVYPLDGLITEIPFPDEFADLTLGGHVFGDQPDAELSELLRVTRPGGMVILCPGGKDQDDDRHTFLESRGFAWARFEQPEAGMVRKYWMRR